MISLKDRVEKFNNNYKLESVETMPIWVKYLVNDLWVKVEQLSTKSQQKDSAERIECEYCGLHAAYQCLHCGSCGHNFVR